jgi:hypothetical protein
MNATFEYVMQRYGFLNLLEVPTTVLAGDTQ